jgi:hypothetical protein
MKERKKLLKDEYMKEIIPCSVSLNIFPQVDVIVQEQLHV